jgi:hypothetical protein
MWAGSGIEWVQMGKLGLFTSDSNTARLRCSSGGSISPANRDLWHKDHL